MIHIRSVRAIASLLIAATAVSAAFAQQASLTLQNADAAYCYTNQYDWDLTKIARPTTFTNGAGTVVWDVTATRTGPVANFTVHGVLTIANTGSAPATIGNIILNLQRPNSPKQGSNASHVSVAANVADATNGNAATSGKFVASASQENTATNNHIFWTAQGMGGNYSKSGATGTFTETSGSGDIYLFDIDNNSVFNMVPQPVIPIGGSVTLRYMATFNPATIATIPAGTPLRVEALVSFGNAGARGGSGATATNIDINGNGGIDTDERNVRTVPSRVTMDPLPTAPEECNASATVTDPEVHTTGTVNASNFDNGGIGNGTVINGSSSWVVSVDVTGGVEGGLVCNTAYLNTDGGEVGLLLNQPQTVINGGFEEPAIAPGTFGIYANIPGWSATGAGIEIQNNVAGSPHGGAQHVELDSNSPSWMSQTFNTIASKQYTVKFWYSPRPSVGDNAIDVYRDGNFVMSLQADGTNNSDTVWTEYSFSFIGSGATAIEFRDASNPDSLGGYIDDVSMSAGYAYECCPAISLEAESCVIVPGGGTLPPQFTDPGNYCSFSQGGLGGNGAPYNLMAANFNAMFPTGLEVGIGYSALFTSASAVQDFMPPTGPGGTNPLTSDLINPPAFGGNKLLSQMAALKINIALCDVGATPTPLNGIKFGEIIYIGPGYFHNMTIRQILAISEVALGGGGFPAGYNGDSLSSLMEELATSWDIIDPITGMCIPSLWAVQNLSWSPAP